MAARNNIRKSAWLWLSDEENWERFNDEDNAQIKHTLDIENKGVVLERNYTTYFLDLLRLTQTNACTGRRRPIFQVQQGSDWHLLSEDGSSCEAFSRAETEQMERAFFQDNDMLILQRGDEETLYVDFMKWTVADLGTGRIRHIKVTPQITDDKQLSISAPKPQSQWQPQPQEDRSKLEAKKLAASATPSKPQQQQYQQVAKQPYTPQLAKSPYAHTKLTTTPTNSKLDNGSEESDRAGATTPEEDSNDDVVSDVYNSSTSIKARRNSFQRNPASWRWANDSSWLCYDDEITHLIEREWAAGAPEMMFERSSTAYFIDLINYTQTNVVTGNTRPIQRIEKKSK